MCHLKSPVGHSLLLNVLNPDNFIYQGTNVLLHFFNLCFNPSSVRIELMYSQKRSRCDHSTCGNYWVYIIQCINPFLWRESINWGNFLFISSKFYDWIEIALLKFDVNDILMKIINRILWWNSRVRNQLFFNKIFKFITKGYTLRKIILLSRRVIPFSSTALHIE